MDSTRFNRNGLLLMSGDEDWDDEVFEEDFGDEDDVFEDEWDDESDVDDEWDDSDDQWSI